MNVEFSQFFHRGVVLVYRQIHRVVGWVANLDFFADELWRAFIQGVVDRDGGIIFNLSVDGDLKGHIQFRFGHPFDGAIFQSIDEPVHGRCVDAVMIGFVVFFFQPVLEVLIELIDVVYLF